MKEKRFQRMENEKMLPLILSFSLPSIISMTSMALYNVVDTFWVGRLGTAAIAGLTLFMPLQIFVLAFGLLIGIGAASYISRSFGAREYENANHIFSSTIFLGLITSTIITLLGLTTLKPLLDFIGKDSGVVPQAYDYGVVIVLGIPIMMFNIILSQCARAEGNPNIAMTSQLTGAILNVILDPIFIFPMKMGIKGAAWATVLSSAISLLIILLYFVGPKSHLRFQAHLMRPDRKILREMGKSGIPSFTQQTAAGFVTTLTNSLLAGYGAYALAIMGINNRMVMIFFMPIVGTCQGYMPIAAYNYGARNLARVKDAFQTAIKVVSVICLLGWILIQIHPQMFIRIFSNDPQVLHQGAISLRIINIFLPLIGFQAIGATTYQALGKGLAGFVLSLSRQVLFFLPMVLIFRVILGLNGIFLAFPVADLGAFMVTSLWLRHTFKQFKGGISPTRPPEENIPMEIPL